MSSAHGIVLLLHSALRWAVLGLALAVVIRACAGWYRARSWTGSDEHLHVALLSALDLELALGLALYLFVGPMPRAFLLALPRSLKVPELRFFGLEHALVMLAAVALAHVGRSTSLSMAEARSRQRRVVVTTLPALLLVALAIPWPYGRVERPLLRTALPSAASVVGQTVSGPACPPLYAVRCAPCHGATGLGDGTLSASLRPAPPRFDDAAWQATLSDAELQILIRDGGARAGKSPLMPSHRDLPLANVTWLVRCVRSFRE